MTDAISMDGETAAFASRWRAYQAGILLVIVLLLVGCSSRFIIHKMARGRSMSPYDLIWGVVGLLLTVMVLSYLIGDNLFFRLAAYLFVGVTAGFLSVLIINQILWPYLLQPLIIGSWIEKLWILIPLALAVLLVISQFHRFTGAGGCPWLFWPG
jgi:hypothetical protein